MGIALDTRDLISNATGLARDTVVDPSKELAPIVDRGTELRGLFSSLSNSTVSIPKPIDVEQLFAPKSSVADVKEADAAHVSAAENDINATTTASNTASPDLDRHRETIAHLKELVAANNPTEAKGYLNNIIASGMEMGKFKPGHLEAVADILKESMAQPGVSPAMASQISAHFKSQINPWLPDSEVDRIMERLNASESQIDHQGLHAEPLNPSPTEKRDLLDQQMRAVLIDTTMTADQKVAELRSLIKQDGLTDQEVRNSIDRALPNDRNGFVDALSIDQVQKLQTDMNRLDKEFGTVLGLWENNGLQRALDRKEEALKSEQESQRLNTERAAKEEQERESIQVHQALLNKTNDLLLDQNLDIEEKIASLKKLKEEQGLSSQGFRDLIGEALKTKGTEFVKELDLPTTLKIQADMDRLDDQFGNMLGMWENNTLQRELKNHARDLIRRN